MHTHFNLRTRVPRGGEVPYIRYAVTYHTLLRSLLLACFFFVPQVSHAQTCEWERFLELPAGMDVIEVLRHGGYGPPAGRTLVSVDASGRVTLLARGQCPDRALRGRLATPTFDELVDECGFRRMPATGSG